MLKICRIYDFIFLCYILPCKKFAKKSLKIIQYIWVLIMIHAFQLRKPLKFILNFHGKFLSHHDFLTVYWVRCPAIKDFLSILFYARANLWNVPSVFQSMKFFIVYTKTKNFRELNYEDRLTFYVTFLKEQNSFWSDQRSHFLKSFEV